MTAGLQYLGLFCKMMKHGNVLGLCCALLLALSGCSRQQSDWQKTRETNTADAYEQFLKKYPTGEFTAQAQARVKELYEERDWQKARDADTPEAYQAFLKQYPEGKWTEEARIRVENFTLAQAPGTSATPASGTEPGVAATGTPPGADSGENENAPPPGAAPPQGAPPPGTPKPRMPTAAPTAPPQSHPAPAAAGRPAPRTAEAKVAAGSYAIQLGAFKSGPGAAHKRWAHLQKEFPKVLAGLSSTVVPKKTAAGTLYRLQATGLTEKHARAICTSLKSKSQVCVVVPPGHV